MSSHCSGSINGLHRIRRFFAPLTAAGLGVFASSTCANEALVHSVSNEPVGPGPLGGLLGFAPVLWVDVAISIASVAPCAFPPVVGAESTDLVELVAFDVLLCFGDSLVCIVVVGSSGFVTSGPVNGPGELCCVVTRRSSPDPPG